MTSHFDQLLQAAAAQPEPQQLLFVFAVAALPEDATPEERERFEQGRGGNLTPSICVDKAPGELSDFDALLAESLQAGPPWQVMFIAALGGKGGLPPSAVQIEKALKDMVERVRLGRVEGLMALDARGEPLHFA